MTDIDWRRSNIVLDPKWARPTHCTLYAQLNSGFNIWILESDSASKTFYTDKASQKMRPSYGKQTVKDLETLKIGPYESEFHLRTDLRELRERERWFRRHEPLLVTVNMLEEQLVGKQAEYKFLSSIGKGGFGEIFKAMEKQTGLMVAIKKQVVNDDQEVRS